MENVMVYPFGKEVYYLINTSRQIRVFNITDIVSLRGWNEEGKEYSINGNRLTVSGSYSESLRNENVTAVWFVENEFSLDFERYYLLEIRECIKYGKKIIMGSKLKKKAEAYEDLKDINYCEPAINQGTLPQKREMLSQINTPVIFVCSMFPSLGKFEIQLRLRQELIRNGYSLLQIGTKEESKYFGFYSMPSFMYDQKLSDETKIIMFNTFVKDKEEEEKPELIIVGIPGEMFVPSVNCVFGFGMLAMKLFTAISPDVVIMNIPYEEYEAEDLEILSERVNARFGTKVDFFNITDNLFRIEDSESKQKACYISMDGILLENGSHIDKALQLKENNQITRLAEKVIEKLKGYGEIVSI